MTSMPASVGGGVKIAFVNADSLNEKYVWLKEQSAAIKQRVSNAEKAMEAKQTALERDFMTLQEKYQTGTVPPAEIEKEAAALEERRQRLMREGANLEKQLAEDADKARNDMMTNLESQLKTIQAQIGYDYILSYQRGAGQILLTNDSLNITKQVLDLLNAKKQ
jgi:Skp family chaperone for outer membrane proteins